MDIHLTVDQETRLAELAARQGRNADDLVREALEHNPPRCDHPNFVIPGLDPGISGERKEMAGSSPAMTSRGRFNLIG